jgi:hypothetical protein
MKALCRPLLMLLTLLALADCSNYNCDPEGLSHCYGVAQVPVRDLESFGTFVDVGRGLNPGDGVLTNEIWLVDFFSNGCSVNNICWVEVGYILDDKYRHFGLDPHFVWAERAPNGVYHEHALGRVPDNYLGRKVLLVIRKTGPDTWEASVHPPAEFEGDPVLAGLSLSNAMAPHRVHIGMEMVGTSGAVAEPVTFTGHAFKVTTSPFIFILSADGVVRSDNPPRGTWLSPPSARASSGPTFQTQCCN